MTGPAVVADAERGGFLIVRLENGVTVPAQKARLQLRDPALHGADKPRRPQRLGGVARCMAQHKRDWAGKSSNPGRWLAAPDHISADG